MRVHLKWIIYVIDCISSKEHISMKEHFKQRDAILNKRSYIKIVLYEIITDNENIPILQSS